MNTTQKNLILADLKRGKVLTPIDSIKLHGCTKLSTRCSELIDEGYKIKKKMVKVKTRFGATNVMSYWMGKSKSVI